MTTTARTVRDAAIDAATADVREILPPGPLLRACRGLANADSRLTREVLGVSDASHPIECYRLGTGRQAVLLYGFPDPGEAIGGTSIFALMQALLGEDTYLNGLDVSWSFFPVMNRDDQPGDGEQLVSVMRDPNRPEFDWCVDAPRQDTRALLDHAAAIRPVFTYPLHDEFHSGEDIPACLGVTPRPLPRPLCEDIRDGLLAAGFNLETSLDHPVMGPAFLDPATQFPDDFPKSTFATLAQYGTVLHCELSNAPGRSARDLVRAQLRVGLAVLDHLVGQR